MHLRVLEESLPKWSPCFNVIVVQMSVVFVVKGEPCTGRTTNCRGIRPLSVLFDVDVFYTRRRVVDYAAGLENACT